jgi:RNA polymerase sigma factor (sigma-70 family)
MGNMTYGRVLYDKGKHAESEWFTLAGGLLHYTISNKTFHNIEETKELLHEMSWVRAIYEELIDSFLDISRDYNRLCVEEARLCRTLLPSFGTQLARIRLRKERIEGAVGLDQRRLYGVVNGVAFHLAKYHELRNVIITPYLRLVFSEASKLSGPSRAIFEDTFQSGVFGLTRAISTFFRERQTYFSGYARWWVRQSILLSLKEEVSFFKIPSAVWHVYNKLERGEKIEENSERIRQYVNVIKLVPIDQPVQHNGNQAKLLDTLVDGGAEEQLEEEELSDALIQLLSNLPKETEKYICLKHGVISHLQERIRLKKADVLREQARQTIALMRFNSTIE